jgi:CubicO group peptidase (beta-lactamase class C family)
MGQTKQPGLIPETPAGKQFSHWLDVFSSGDQKKFEQFIAKNYNNTLLEKLAAYYRAERLARTYTDVRSYEIRSIEKTTEHEIVALTQASLTGLWISDYTVRRIAPPVNTAGKLSEAQLSDRISVFMEKLVHQDAYSGTVLVAKGARVIFKKAYGFASKAHNVKNRIDTKLNIASIGKLFTAVAIAQLIEKGKLSFTDTVGKIFPDFPNKEISRKVTIQHLLSHTSGMGDMHGPEFVCRKDYLKEIKDYNFLFEKKDSLAFEPGERWQYSNTGYILLGAVIEKVSGENYFDYVHKHIFLPSGMKNTDFYEVDQGIPNLATGYTNFIDYGEDYQEFHLGPRRSIFHTVKGTSQGGAFSTAEDLLKFTQALKKNKLIADSTFKTITAPRIYGHRFDINDVYWGYGFQLEKGKRVIGHYGGDLGISAGLSMYPDTGDYTLIVLSNYDRGGMITIYKIQEMILQQ